MESPIKLGNANPDTVKIQGQCREHLNVFRAPKPPPLKGLEELLQKLALSDPTKARRLDHEVGTL